MSARRSAFAAVVLLGLAMLSSASSLARSEPTTHAGSAVAGDRAAPVDSLAAPPIVTRPAALDALHSLDGYFLENRGQVSPPVRFYAVGNPSVAFREDGVMFVLRDAANVSPDASREMDPPRFHRQMPEAIPSRAHAYLVRFDGALDASPRGVAELPVRA